MELYVVIFSLLVFGGPATRASRDGSRATAHVRLRRADCLHGTYNHSGIVCCRCPAGEYVEKHCTQSSSTQCHKCDPGFYSKYNNYLQSCSQCSSCNENLHLEVATNCTSVQDTKCKCMEGHYCAERECRSCMPCNTCDDYKIVKPCTETNDAVCGEHEDHSVRNTIIAIVVSAVLIVVILLISWYVWKQKHRGSLSLRAQHHIDQQNQMDPLLTDIDLSPYLYTIVEEVGHKTVKELAIRSGIAQTRIDMHIDSYPNNIREQCYYILKDWYEKQGFKNACSVLITELKKMGRRASADKLAQKFHDDINRNRNSS